MSGCSMAAIYFRAALFISYIRSNTNKMRKYVINNNMTRGAKGHDLPLCCIAAYLNCSASLNTLHNVSLICQLDSVTIWSRSG